MKLTILIGCFNEKATILRAIEEAKEIDIDKEIFVIDNCSTDGTREILQGLKNDRALKIILHAKNMGTGYSAREAIRLAQGDYFYAPGADLEYKMNDLYKMTDKIKSEELDAVFGSRLLEKESIPRFDLIKERPFWLGTIIATCLINKFYRRNFTDVIAPKLIRTDILKKLGVKADNHASEFELVSRLCKKGYRIGEIPVYYKPRSREQGKTIKAIDMLPALWVMLKVKFFG